MAEEGSEPRATVALVAEKVDGLKQLTNAGFSSVQRQLDSLSGLPREVSELKEKVREQDLRINMIERREEKTREWRRGPALLVIGGMIVAVINMIPVVFHVA